MLNASNCCVFFYRDLAVDNSNSKGVWVEARAAGLEEGATHQEEAEDKIPVLIDNKRSGNLAFEVAE